MTDLSTFSERALPGLETLTGNHVALEPLCDAHAESDLAANLSGPENQDIWTYMPLGPFLDTKSFVKEFKERGDDAGWNMLVIRCLKTQQCLGSISFMRLRPEHGSAEIGAVAYSHKLQRTTAATEALFLMARHAFDDLGYRRLEWKCNNANAASKRAAVRYGFRYEGLFRNDMVTKGQNRDTAWYSIIDTEWAEIKSDFETWLSSDNFDLQGIQKIDLNELRARRQMRSAQQ